MSDIIGKVYDEGPKGWSICSPASGKRLVGSRQYYPTREEADADLVGAIARHEKIVAANIAAKANQGAGAQPARTGWSNAARRRAGRPAGRPAGGIGSLGLYLSTPTDAAGGCYYCGVINCTDCG